MKGFWPLCFLLSLFLALTASAVSRESKETPLPKRVLAEGNDGAGKTMVLGFASGLKAVNGPPLQTRDSFLIWLGMTALGLGAAVCLGLLGRRVRRQASELQARLEKETLLERRYRALFEANPLPMWVYELDKLAFIEVNEAAIRNYGYTREEFLGMTVRDLQPIPSGRGLPDPLILTEAIRIAEPPGIWRHRKKNGEVIEVEVTTRALELDGRLGGLMLAHDVTASRKTHAALLKSEQYRRTLLEADSECVKVVGRDGSLLDINASGLRMAEAESLEEVLKRPVGELVAPEYRQAFSSLQERVFAGGDGSVQLEMVGLKGARRFLEVRAVPLLRDREEGTVMLAICRDITQQRAAAALLESERRFRVFFEQASVGVAEVDAVSARYLRVNQRYCDIVGYEREEMERMDYFSITHPEDLESEEDRRARLLAGEIREFTCEKRYFRKDGRLVWATLSVSPLWAPGAPPTSQVAVVADITRRKLAEAELQASRERFATVFRTSPDAIMIVRAADGCILEVNPSFVRLLGYSEDEVKGRATDALRLWVDESQRISAAADLMATGSVKNLEAQLRTKEGRIITCLGSAEVIEFGGERCLLSLTRDISDRKASEEALRERERAYATLLKNLAGMVYRCQNDARWTVLFVSEGCFALTGYRPGQLVGNREVSFSQLVHPEDAKELWEKCRNNLAKQLPCTNEYRIRAADGAEKWVWDQAQGIYSESGELMFVEGYIRDITARKQAEAALRESRERLDEILSSIEDVVWSTSPDSSQVLYLSPAAEAVYGWSVSEMMAKPRLWLEVVHEDDRAAVNEALRELEPRGVFSFEYRIRRPDGSVRWVQDHSRLVRDKAGRPLRIDGIVRDITLRKMAEEERIHLERQIQQAQKLESLGLMAGGIAHDFNNLLTAVMGNICMAMLEVSQEPAPIRSLREAEKACQRAADLARQMLAYSGKGRFVSQRLDLSEVVKDMTPMLQVSISKKAALTFVFPPEPAVIEADVTQVRQVLLNLVINASEAIGDAPGAITVSTGARFCDENYFDGASWQDSLPDGFYAFLEVADTGHGIPQEKLTKIFDPFFTTKFTGRGLGLAAVQGIVRSHKGAVQVLSQPGKGAAFRVLFPAAEGAPQALEAAAISPSAWRGEGLILLVEDEEPIRQIAQLLLEYLGFEILPAADGLEAVEAFRDRGSSIKAVLLDLTMPRMDGEETFRELRRLRSDVPIIVCSGFSEQDVAGRFSGKGEYGFVAKPYNLGNLQSALQQQLGR